MEWEAAPWHRWTNKERAAGQARARGGEELSEEGEQETPRMQRLRLGGHSGTLHTTDQGHSQELIWFINLVPKR